MKQTFDHSEKSLPLAIGIEEEDLNALEKKAKDCILKNINEKRSKVSHFIEDTRNIFSYDELVILTGTYLKDKYISIKQQTKPSSLDSKVEAVTSALKQTLKEIGLDADVFGIDMTPKSDESLEDFIKRIKNFRRKDDEGRE